MRKTSAVVLLTVVIASCGGGISGGSPETDDSAEMMATALVELVTNDHTFGEGPPPFTEFLIQNQVDPSAGNVSDDDDNTARPLTDGERTAIENALSPLGTVQWIDDPSDWRTEDLVPTVEGAAILGVGEPTIESETGLVPVSMWCGGLCGTWLTYRLDVVNDVWTVTEIEGPIAIS